MHGLFVLGTDTGVGKTLTCQALLAGAPVSRVRYWKPVQTGLAEEAGDSAAVAAVANPDAVWEAGVRLALPASPHYAAAVQGTAVDGPALVALAAAAPGPADTVWVVEGAGGLLVPLNDQMLQADLVQALGLPAVLVVHTRLGAINHTLLTIDALRSRQIPLLGLVLSGPDSASLRTALAAHTAVPVLGHIPQLPEQDQRTLANVGQDLWQHPALQALWMPRPAPAPPAPSAIWPPFTQTQLAPPPLPVQSAKGAWLTLQDGSRLLDGISSWWTSLHGHGHPALVHAVQRQMATLDHVLLAGCSHQPAEQLAQKLVARAPAGLTRVFYSDDGSTAVEVALKLAVQYAAQTGQPHKRQLAALAHSYHGDTVGALSVGDGNDWGYDFAPLRLPVLRLPAPCVSGLPTGPLSAQDEAAVDAAVLRCTELLTEHGTNLAALIVEPLIQGAGGMRMQPPRYLQALRQLCTQHGILLVADEVMTGFGRTGALFACNLAGITPDLLCLSKAITGGILPLAVTMATDAVFAAFQGDSAQVAFLHGHSFTGHPPACAAALASLNLLEQEQTLDRIAALQQVHQQALTALVDLPQVASVRWLGQIGALQLAGQEGYFAASAGPQLRQYARQHGLLLRPLGPVVYLLPPACTTPQELARAWGIVADGLRGLVTKA
jgi:adenosylmethionine-8-amino-7-oxononanoate aminotransferase